MTSILVQKAEERIRKLKCLYENNDLWVKTTAGDSFQFIKIYFKHLSDNISNIRIEAFTRKIF